MFKLINKKLMMTLGALAVSSLLLGSVDVHAATQNTTATKEKEKPTSFKREWEKKTTYTVDDKYVGVLVWGYDKDYINEDYAWTKGKNGYSTKAAIKRVGKDENFIENDKWASPEEFNKMEVCHQVYTVKYRIKWNKVSFNSSELESTTKDSNYKD